MELARQARDLGMPALALTDDETLAGVVPLCEACRRVGIRPIIGCQLNVLAHNATSSKGAMYRIVLLVETEPGYRNLVSLVTKAHSVPRHEKPFVRFDDLRERAAGLIALVGGASSELFSLLLNDKTAETEAYVTQLARAFGRDNVVFELQDHNLPKQKQINERLHKLGEFLTIRCVATNDVHYLKPEDSLCHAFLSQERAPKRYDPKELKNPAFTRHLASADEMRSKFLQTPRVLYATAELSERCIFQPSFERKRFPIHDFVRGFDADSFLWDLTFKEARGRFPELTPDLKDRLNQEFDYIRNERLSNNLLLLWNVAQFCRKNRITAGVGRGNLISSLVAYIIGITHINPLDYKLRFLGFDDALGFERSLAVEVPGRHTGALEQFLKDTFGQDCCAAAGRMQWFEPRAIARELCAWLDIPAEHMKELTSYAEGVSEDDEKGIDELVPRRFNTAEFPALPLAKYMLGRILPRPKGLEPADDQFALSGENLSNLLPRVRCGDRTILEADEHVLDGLNIPRLYIRHSVTLDVLDQAADWVRNEENPQFDPDRIPLDDSETYELLSKGLTNGIEPFHSITLKSLLRAHKPRNFMGLIKIKSMEKVAEHEHSDVCDHVPECLLTYRSAFIKAHYPISFMAALLTQSFHNHRRFPVLLRETKRMGIKIIPPHVNLSTYEFIPWNKQIRTGLVVVPGMTKRAYHEFQEARKGGDFHDLADLWKRTEGGEMTPPLIAAMIKVGVLDCFGVKRPDLLRELEKLAHSAPGGIAGEDAGGNGQHAAERGFDLAPADYIIPPEQVAVLKDMAEKCRALAPHEIANCKAGAEVHVAGFIDHVEHESPLIDDGDQVLLDLEGRVVSMPLKAARLYHVALASDGPVLIGGTLHRRKEELYIKALTAFTLSDVLEMSNEIVQIELDLQGEDARTLKLISRLVRHYRSPGGTEVKVRNAGTDALTKWRVFRIAKTPVFFSPPLYYALKKILPEDRISLVASHEMDSELLHTLSPQRFPRSGAATEPVPAS